MNTSRFPLYVGYALLLAVGPIACADASGEDTESSEEEIRGPKASELLGTLSIGGRATFDYTYSTSKRYRAYKLVLAQGDSVVLDASAVATDDGAGEGVVAAPMMWLTTASSSSLQETPVAADVNAKGGNHAAIRFTAPRAMTVYALLREKSLGRAKFTVSLSRAAATDDPFDPASCSGPLMARSRAIELLGPGGTWTAFGAKEWLTRSRTCNAVSGCSSFSVPKAAILKYENSDQWTRTFIDAPVTLGAGVAVVAGELRFGLKAAESQSDLRTSNGARFFNADLSDTQGFEFKKTGLGMNGNDPRLVWKTETFVAEDVHMVATNSCIRLWKKTSTPDREDEWAQLWRF